MRTVERRIQIALYIKHTNLETLVAIFWRADKVECLDSARWLLSQLRAITRMIAAWVTIAISVINVAVAVIINPIRTRGNLFPRKRCPQI